MATQGPLTWFNKALQRVSAAEMAANNFKAVLSTTSQTFDENFVGASGQARYADLTAELGTANGYTAGGLLLTTPTISLSSGIVKWSTDPFSWTLTGSISLRYLLIYNDSSTNDDLLCFADMNTDGAANITAIAGILGYNPDPSLSCWLQWEQP